MNLPEDLMVEILLWLPVKSLIKFKCVCKSWSGLVESPTFISQHLNNQRDSARLLVSHRDNITSKRVISTLHDGTLETIANQNHDIPFLNEKFGHIRLVGPCNGIVCLYGYPGNIALWNPAIKEFKVLPVSTISRPSNVKVRGGDIGFGYDPKTNDFKVLQILFCCSKQLGLTYNHHVIEMYNLSTNIWRRYGEVLPANIMYFNATSMVYKNKIFCWWAQNYDGDDDHQHEVILSFDMCTEVFEKTSLPPNIGSFGGERRVMRAIAPLNESVALIVYRIKEVEKCFDIWVMNEFGVKESWTRLLTIGPLSGVERPLGFWKKSELMLENSYGQLVIYNPDTQQLRNLGLHGKRDRLEILIYKESVFSIC